MSEETQKERLEQQLAERALSIRTRIDVLEEEIATTPAAILSKITANPYVGLGAMVTAGLAVGLIFGGRKTRRSRAESPHRKLLDEYIDAIGEEIARDVARGRGPREAVQETLRRVAPVILYAPQKGDKQADRSVFREIGWFALQSALGFAIKMAGDMLLAGVQVGASRAMQDQRDEGGQTSNGMRKDEGEPRGERHVSGDGASGPPGTTTE